MTPTTPHLLERSKSGRLSYLTGGTGAPVLILHGIPGSAQGMQAFAERLAAHHRVVVPDLLGFGQSDPPGIDYYMEGQAQEIGRLLRSLDIRRAHVVAHDYGGPVALTMLAQKRVEARSITLASTNLFTDTPIPFPLQAAKIWGLRRLVLGPVIGTRLGLAMLQRNASVRHVDRGTWKGRGLTRTAAATTYKIFVRSLANLQRNYAAVQAQLSRLNVPTLVLWGEADPLLRVEAGRRTAAAIDRARLVIVPRCGHFMMEECPDLVAQEAVSHIGMVEPASGRPPEPMVPTIGGQEGDLFAKRSDSQPVASS